jgi:hypothetical protein
LLAAAELVVPDALTAYADLAPRLPALTASLDPMWKAHSWFGFFALLLPGQPALAGALGALGAMATLLTIGRVQAASTRDALARWFAAAVLATVLMSPHLMLYDLSLLVVAGLLLPPETLAGDRAFGAVAAIWIVAALSQPVALVLRQTVGTSVQISVPVMAVAGYLVLRDARAS